MRDVDALQNETGVAGEVDVLVEGGDLTDPKVIAWMRDYQDEVLLRHGYSAGRAAAARRCARAVVAGPVPHAGAVGDARAGTGAARRRAAVLLPSGDHADRRTAVLAFGLRLQSLEGQREVIEDMRERLRPPEGVSATVAGLPVLAADANHAMSDPLRRALTALAGLVAVLLALFAVYRSWARAWVPLVPIALATGWSALVLWLVASR